MTIKKNTSQTKRAAAKTDRKRGFQRFMNTNWTVGDFLLQLSTIIIGIFVTFGGSALIQRYSNRKATVHILSMVRAELESNRKNVEKLQDHMLFDHYGAQAIEQHIDNPKAMPLDSVARYEGVLLQTWPLEYQTYAFDVFQNSSQPHTAIDKALLRDMFMVYDNMTRFDDRVKIYNDRKTQGVEEVLFYSNGNLMSDILKSEDGWQLLMSAMTGNSNVRNFIATASYRYGFLNTAIIPFADSVMAQTKAVIERIDKEVGTPTAN